MSLVLVEVTVRVPDAAGDDAEARKMIAESALQGVTERAASAFEAMGLEVVSVEGVEELPSA